MIFFSKMSSIQNSSVVTVVMWSVKRKLCSSFLCQRQWQIKCNEKWDGKLAVQPDYSISHYRLEFFPDTIHPHFDWWTLITQIRLPWMRKVIGWVKAQSPIPGTQCNRQNQSKKKAKIWGHASIPALCVSGFSLPFGKILPFFWETQLGFWPSRCKCLPTPLGKSRK